MNNKKQMLAFLCFGFLAVGAFSGIRHEITSAKAEELISFTDDELETYDTVTLRDIGLGENVTIGSSVFDNVGALSGGDSTHSVFYANSNDNVTASTVLEFVINIPSDYEPATSGQEMFDFRIGSTEAWKGYKFTFNPHYNGIVYVGIDDNTKSSGESNITRDEDHLVQYGAIHIKNSDDIWLYAKVDGVLYASSRTQSVASYNKPTANIYAFACKTNTNLYLKSTGSAYAYKNVIDTNDTPVIFQSNDTNGFYFKLANENAVPWDGGWSYRSVPATKYEALVNGQPVASNRCCLINHYSPLEYYAALVDSAIKPQVNDLIVISGFFKTVIDSTNRAYIYKINEIVCMFDGKNYIQQPSLYDYLSDKLNSLIDTELYDEDGLRQINEILEQFENEMTSAVISYQRYQAYNKAANAIEEVEYDESMAEIKLNEAKQAAIESISNYPDFDNYYEEQLAEVNDLIDEAIVKINNATNKKSVESILNEYKLKIDAVKTKIQFGEDAILNQEEGYEQYLDNYDVATLSDVNMKETEYIKAFHTNADGVVDNGNIGNEGSELTTLNTFANSKNNPNGNVIFQFTYCNSTTAAGKYGATIFARLRGVQYFGYRFCLGLENGGIEINRMEGDGALNKRLGGKDFVFSAGVTYEVKLVAIDVKYSNDVWLAVIVDDEIVLSYITEKISFCTSTRIAISDSHMQDGSKEETVLGNLLEGTTCSLNYVNIGRAKMNDSEESTSNGIYLTMMDGDIPYDSLWQSASYPTSSTAITINGQGVCTNNVGAIKKYGPNSYYVALVDMGVAVNDGDELVINGSFTCFTSTTGKVGFSIRETKFVYHADSGWEFILTLDGAKEDAIFEIENYVDLSEYNEAAKETITALISKAINDINACTTIEQITEVLETVKESIDAIPSIMDSYRLHAVEEIDAYKLDQYDLYREEQIQEIISIKANAKLQVMYADNEPQIDAIVAQLKLDVDSVQTDVELLAEELAQGKEDAKKELRNFYSRLSLDSYSEDVINQINTIITDAMDMIEAANLFEELEGIVNNAENAINELIAPKNDKKGCGGSIVMTSGVVTLVSILGVGMGLLKRKEN